MYPGDSGVVYHELARALVQANELEAAVDAYRHAIDVHPSPARTRRLELAKLLMQAGEVHVLGAVQLLKKAAHRDTMVVSASPAECEALHLLFEYYSARIAEENKAASTLASANGLVWSSISAGWLNATTSESNRAAVAVALMARCG